MAERRAQKIDLKKLSPTEGTLLIMAERRRQIDELGRSDSDDDSLTDGSLLRCAINVARDVGEATKTKPLAGDWPTDRAYHVRMKYGKDKIRRLTIAAALIAAEIDRLLRAKKGA